MLFCPLNDAARDAPQKLALVDKDRNEWTFCDLDRLAEEMTCTLFRLGVREGDLIAVLHPPCAELIALFFATWRLGASVCPLSLRLPQPEKALHRLNPKLFIRSFPIQPLVRPSRRLHISSSLLLFTSGSTGMPKIAVLSRENLLASGRHFPCVDLQSQDKWLLSLPLHHVGGIGILIRCILARAAIALDEKDPDITHLSYVPTQLYRSWPLYRNLKCLLLGGAPIASFPDHLPTYATYGLTEMASWVAVRKTPPAREGGFALGAPLPGNEIQLAPDGEVSVRGPSLFQGYWDGEKLERPPSWLATKDLGTWDPKEGLILLGRKDWQFISGGENIQPEEIETHLLQIPGITEAVVLPQSDPEFGHRPIACLTLAYPENFHPENIKSLLAKKLPKYKLPIAFHILKEFPKKGEKIDRRQLASSFLKSKSS